MLFANKTLRLSAGKLAKKVWIPLMLVPGIGTAVALALWVILGNTVLGIVSGILAAAWVAAVFLGYNIRSVTYTVTAKEVILNKCFGPNVTIPLTNVDTVERTDVCPKGAVRCTAGKGCAVLRTIDGKAYFLSLDDDTVISVIVDRSAISSEETERDWRMEKTGDPTEGRPLF